MKQKVIVIVGPTAVGKTPLSIELAKEIDGEIISADSRQVYRGLDIGSGKVTHEEMRGVPHHLLDVANPKEVFNASDFVRLAQLSIYEIDRRQKLPVIVGGTGFYIDALVGRRKLAGVPPDPDLRLMLSGFDLEQLQAELKRLDPERFETVEQKNPRRLIRAIEVAATVGNQKPNTKVEPSYDVLWIGLTIPLPELKERIHARLTARMDSGMLDEVKSLHAHGLSYERMENLGLEYRYLARHLLGALSYDEMVEVLEREIVKYAKRQMTWFKKNKNIHWFSPGESAQAISLAKGFLNT